MRRWTITTTITGKPREVEIRLYPTTKAMQAAGRRYVSKWSKKQGFYEAAAICHGFHVTKADGTERPRVAIIRLSQHRLTPLVISHEIAHAAQHIYGLDHLDDRPLEDHFTPANEEFAHLMGELFAAAWRVLGPAAHE